MAPTATQQKDLDKAVKERESAQHTIEWLEDRLREHTTTPLTEIKVDDHLKTLAINSNKVVDTHERIVANCDPADTDGHKKEYKALLNTIMDVKCGLLEIKKTFPVPSTSSSTSSSSSSGPVMDIRLPRLSLPTFSGKMEEWASFRDMFSTAIHTSSKLSNCQKLTYLKSQVTGEAARLIQSLVISDVNYDIAWKQLNDRYQNDRQLLFIILKRLTSQIAITAPSSSSLRSMVDVSKECLSSLRVLSQPVDQWDSIILYILFQKLDPYSRELFEQGLKDCSIPKLQGFFDFLEQRSRALEAGGSKSTQQPKQFPQQKQNFPQRNQVHHAQSTSDCMACNQPGHFLFRCSKFLSMGISERADFAKKHQLCYNCLRPGHSLTQCGSSSSCRTCSKKHHTLLHRPSEPPAPAVVSNNCPSLSLHTNYSNSMAQTLLATAIVHVLDRHGVQQTVRVLLDGGSDTHVITSKCIKRLGLSYKRKHAVVTGLSETPVGTTKGIVDLDFSPHFDSSVVIQAKHTCIMSTVTAHLPLHPCYPHPHHFQSLALADQSWHTPAEIDMLVGVSLFYGLISGERITGQPGEPFALKSQLGWLVVGEVGNNLNSHSYHAKVDLNEREEQQRVQVTDIDLDQRLRSFWELEAIPEGPSLSEEEKMCEEHFQSTHKVQADGKFVVKIPFKTTPPDVTPSRDMALRRLKSLERRLTRFPEYKKEYSSFMEEYLTMGHMEEVPPGEVNSAAACYIPHQFVIKEESTTTKFRVVFDASARTSSGKSLNDCMMVGPTIQKTLFDIILRFRSHKVAFTADVAKMYRQVIVTKEDADYQRILWRDDPSQPVRDFRLLTVTYGTASAPYLATRALQQLAINNLDKYPLASKVLLNDFYVDDCMSGAQTVQEAIQIQQQLLELMALGGMELRKWSSSHPQVIQTLPEELRQTKSLLSMELAHTVKTLGIYWQPESDSFLFKVHNDDKVVYNILSKRVILSEIAKIFDPIGWLAPVVITAKILMQSLWRLDLGWDDQVPQAVSESWAQFREQLTHIENIRIPRGMNNLLNSKLALLGFSDASKRAFSAVVYLGVYSDNSAPIITIITSKTRVAPSKIVSIPRLELCGSLLLAQLMGTVSAALDLNFHHTSAWTDSTIALAWIKSPPSRWKDFVANRVTKIQALVPASQWGHVAGIDNPADCASRGVDPIQFSNFNLWWRGPSWLHRGFPPTSHSGPIQVNDNIDMEERKEVISLRTQLCHPILQMDKYSTLVKLQRVTSWLFRFINNIRARVSSKSNVCICDFQGCRPGETTGVGLPTSGNCGLGVVRQCTSAHQNPWTFRQGPLHPDEYHSTMIYLVRATQHQHFAKEMDSLSQDKPFISEKSPLLPLHPFLDQQRVLRVGGRIRKAQVPYNVKHPMLLPRHSHFTSLIIQDAHRNNFHAGPQLLLSTLQSKFWILRGRDAVRQEIRKCVICTKLKAQTMQQLMADLPQFRVRPCRPFSKCGVDFAGPFQLKPMIPRSKSTIKAYICVFVCMVTRAIHLEIVSGLSTDSFLSTLRRFIARRGRPSDIHSDCGTNFVGASRELKELQSLLNSQHHKEEVSNQMALDGIQWHFNPPGTPHFGGIWEAGVKSVKFHLRRVMGPHRLNYEEMTTTVTQIEALLNSRPLTPESADPSDLNALTPGHFLIGAPLTSAPDPSVCDINDNRLSRWQLVQKMYQSFWTRWSKEYLTRLQQRPKWLTEQKNISPGDLVTIKDENLSPMFWRLGRVQEIFPGQDGLTRVVTLKTKDGIVKRPVAKLCLLPVSNS